MGKKRADILLFEKGLVDSREKGKRLIMEGVVFIGTEKVQKPGDFISEDDEIVVKNNPLIYVSRGGLKLEKAIEFFNLDLKDKVAMDIGASTGGFTDCMLKNGALKVFAVDVGYNQLDWKLRNDHRVVVMERTNIRNVKLEDIGQQVDFISIDVSFISLKLVLPVAKEILKDNGDIVALIKPQFEAGREKVGKKGIVREKSTHMEVIKNTLKFSKDMGLILDSLTYSPVTGATGNIEFLARFKKSGDMVDEIMIQNIIDDAHSNLK
ncbi:TlyA family RNA methyltransferase [Tissierella creatinini]|nr:TlyA family RNA methyltransferase [Tissierella creatinini]TJX69099.1 TlyA family RNA methyltransferase [Soehngenia saccharolytica]